MPASFRNRTATSSFGTVAREGHDSGEFYRRRMHEHAREPARELPAEDNPPPEPNTIYCGDARNMHQLPDRCVHLMVTSPPYNVGKDYDEDLSMGEYCELLSGVLSETFRVLAHGGRACVNIANVGRTPYLPLTAAVHSICGGLGLRARGEIVWSKGASAGSSCAWGSWRSASNPVLRDTHEYILVFSKGSWGRPKGVSTVGRDEFLEFTKSVWEFPAASAKRAGHPAPFPTELPRRLIELYSYKDDVVLDPFMGSGATAEAALRCGRRYIGYEISADYAEAAQSRLADIDSEVNRLTLHDM